MAAFEALSGSYEVIIGDTFAGGENSDCYYNLQCMYTIFIEINSYNIYYIIYTFR